MNWWGLAKGIIRLGGPFIIDLLDSRQRSRLQQERKDLIRGILQANFRGAPPPKEHHSLVGYLITIDKGQPEGRGFIEAVRKRMKEYLDLGELEEIEYEEFKKKFGHDIYPPAIVIWSTKKEEPFMVIPFYYKGGKKGAVKAKTAEKEVGEILSREIEEELEEKEEEKEFAEV